VFPFGEPLRSLKRSCHHHRHRQPTEREPSHWNAADLPTAANAYAFSLLQRGDEGFLRNLRNAEL
jgi:hypothetical protein